MQRWKELNAKSELANDARPLGRARDTSLTLGAVASADRSALVKIGCTTMLAAIKTEVMTPPKESPDEGSTAIEFYMPPIFSALVWPGRPAREAPVVSKQLSDTSLSSGMINLKELSLVSGKTAWMAYLDIYCWDADGSLFDAAYRLMMNEKISQSILVSGESGASKTESTKLLMCYLAYIGGIIRALNKGKWQSSLNFYCLCYIAYATSNYYFHVSANYIHHGEVDLMIAGGIEAVVIHIGLKGFVPLPQRNDDS